MTTFLSTFVLANIPPENPWSQLALPLGILIFNGSVYLLMRSNLGTRRGYLVMSTSLWGFGFLIALFWAFGAPGTPPNTGPQNLPGQQLDHYLPTWTAFAGDSLVVTEEGSPYTAVADFPDGWGDVPAGLAGDVEIGETAITGFFSDLADEGYTNVLAGDEAQVGETQHAVADNGRPMIAMTLVASCQFDDEGDLPAVCADAGLDVGDPIPEDAVNEDGESIYEPVTFFAFFDEGAPYFPSLVMIGIMFVLFVGHMLLLARDESRERREVAEASEQEEVEKERATVGV